MDPIRTARRVAASTALTLAAACGPPKGIATGTAAAAGPPPPPSPRKLGDVFVLEAGGAQPDDTVVTVPSGARRVVVLRRSAPDFGLFAELDFPARALTGTRDAAGARVAIRPRPGLYALDFELDGSVAEGATITFSYGAHFVAPAGARERYGSDIAFERALSIGRLVGDTLVVFLQTSRPGSDMLSAPLPGPGRYLVAAPRSGP
jgi:hypothetical protein